MLKPAGTFPDLKHLAGRRGTNVALDYHLRFGESETALASADRVFEHTFRTQAVLHLPLEPFVSLAEPGDNRLTIHTASQMPSFVRSEIARLLGWPENRVRVKVPHLGGGFGAKVYIKLEALVAALALIARRPVKIALTMDEQFCHPDQASDAHSASRAASPRMAASSPATARCCGTAAPMPTSARASRRSRASPPPGPTTSSNVSINSFEVYTNRPPAGALRGFGIPQLVWAYESHTDLIARALGIDPVEFRRKNILRDGHPHASGTVMRDAAIDARARRTGRADELERAVRARQRREAARTRHRHRLQGLGRADHVGCDGQCRRRRQHDTSMNTVDMGQGSDTAMAQIVAEVLDLRAEDVRVLNPDTDVTPYDMGTLGSRSTFHMGLAVKRAAEDARDKLKALAAEARSAARQQHPGRRYFPEALRHAGR